jgi:hypothetical protein
VVAPDGTDSPEATFGQSVSSVSPGCGLAPVADRGPVGIDSNDT